MQRSAGTALVLVGALLTAVMAVGGVLLMRGGQEADGPVSLAGAGDPHGVTGELIAFFEQRVERDPADFVSYTKLGEAHVRRARETGDLAALGRAEEALRRALEIRPDHLDAQAQLATVLLALHDFTGARDLGLAVFAADPGATQALAVVGDASLALGDYDAAFRAYGRLATVADGPAVDSRLAHQAELTGDLERAIDLMRQAEEEAAQRGRSREAIAFYRLQLGTLYLNSGRYDDAERWYEAALEALPDYYLARAGLGQVAAARGDTDAAVEQLELAAAAVPQPVLLAALGDLYARSGDVAAAEDQYAAVEFIGRLAEVNRTVFNRDLVLFYADHTIKTDEAVRLALAELDVRRDIYAYDAAAWALYRDGRAAEAAPLMKAALRLGTEDARLFIHAGLVARATGDAAGARDYLTRALELNPHPWPLLADEARQALDALAGESAERGD